MSRASVLCAGVWVRVARALPTPATEPMKPCIARGSSRRHHSCLQNNSECTASLQSNRAEAQCIARIHKAYSQPGSDQSRLVPVEAAATTVATQLKQLVELRQSTFLGTSHLHASAVVLLNSADDDMKHNTPLPLTVPPDGPPHHHTCSTIQGIQMTDKCRFRWTVRHSFSCCKHHLSSKLSSHGG